MQNVNNALDSHKLIMSSKFMSIPLEWWHSYTTAALIQLITSWPFQASVLPQGQKGGLICFILPWFWSIYDSCAVGTVWNLEKLYLLTPLRSWTQNSVLYNWQRGWGKKMRKKSRKSQWFHLISFHLTRIKRYYTSCFDFSFGLLNTEFSLYSWEGDILFIPLLII